MMQLEIRESVRLGSTNNFVNDHFLLGLYNSSSREWL